MHAAYETQTRDRIEILIDHWQVQASITDATSALELLSFDEQAS
jgi:hypothetical protein